MPISQADKDFIKDILDDELEYDKLETLDQKLKNSDFKSAYEAALKEKYHNKKGLIAGYIPMIVFGLLIFWGLFKIFV